MCVRVCACSCACAHTLGYEVEARLLQLAQRQNAQGQESQQRVDERHKRPHIAEGLGEHAGLLLLDEVRGGFEPGDAQQRGGVPKEDGGEGGCVVPAVRVVVDEGVGAADDVDKRNRHENAKGAQVDGEDAQRDDRRLTHTHDVQRGKHGQQHNCADSDGQIFPQVGGILARLRGGHHGGSDVRQEGKARGQRGQALGGYV
mmetsp:Transcript_48936/g.123105  ORF Transcript_48936/g.123105 Transcript_48936/m.123105 type:complete len:201 (+) Transcript_48936:55-657(+)